MKPIPQRTFIDHLIIQWDAALRTVVPPPNRPTQRPCPGNEQTNASHLSQAQKQEIASLMRVNHAGEVCAQALYHGQALTAKQTHIKEQMSKAAQEETDHLAWCEQRLKELNSQVSILNPIWYMGSFLLGAAAGLAGDAWSLGFVAETERQVSAHLQSHLKKLPLDDARTHAILKKMHEDEAHHADSAVAAGAKPLPKVIQWMMHLTSKIMTKTSYYI